MKDRDNYIIDIMQLTKSLLDSPIRNLSSILPDKENKWTDAVSVSLKKTPSLSSFSSLHTGFNRTSHIYNRLGHIVVNPQNLYNTEALTETYAYKYTDGSPHDSIANYNPASTEKFVNDLIDAAKLQRKFFLREIPDYTGMRLASPSYILYGKRGIGKTFFLNHILSRFHHYFDTKNIIWVRVNLVEPLILSSLFCKFP